MNNLTLENAQQMMAAAIATATQEDCVVSVAVTDAGGHLIAFARMDGAEIAGPTLAVDKAYTSVAHRIATRELTSLCAPDGELAGMAANGGGRYVTFGGGVPVWRHGVVVGGVGVSGASTAVDHQCAERAVLAFTLADSSGHTQDPQASVAKRRGGSL